MANYQPTYLGEIELSEETLAHYGVKGMRWRRRIRSAIRNNPISRRRRQNRYVASHIADDVSSGRMRVNNRGNGNTFLVDSHGRRRDYKTNGRTVNDYVPTRVVATRGKDKTSVITVENHRAPNGANVSYAKDQTTTNKELDKALAALNLRDRKKKKNKR